jgi:hypothetical protein
VILIFDNLNLIYGPDWNKPHEEGKAQAALFQPRQADAMTTIYLRSDCGCPKTFLDESTGETVKINTHDHGCLRKRYPIDEDMSDSTIQRRQQQTALKNSEDWAKIEEMRY